MYKLLKHPTQPLLQLFFQLFLRLWERTNLSQAWQPGEAIRFGSPEANRSCCFVLLVVFLLALLATKGQLSWVLICSSLITLNIRLQATGFDSKGWTGRFVRWWSVSCRVPSITILTTIIFCGWWMGEEVYDCIYWSTNKPSSCSCPFWAVRHVVSLPGPPGLWFWLILSVEELQWDWFTKVAQGSCWFGSGLHLRWEARS